MKKSQYGRVTIAKQSQHLPQIDCNSRVTAYSGLSKSKFSLNQTAMKRSQFTSKTFYSKALQSAPQLTLQQYSAKSNMEIHNEFRTLKQQLKYLSEQLNRFIQSKNPKNLSKENSNGQSSQCFFKRTQAKSFMQCNFSNISNVTSTFNTQYSKNDHQMRILIQTQSNNNVIKGQKTYELRKLMQRQKVIDNPHDKKAILNQQILEIKRQILKEKKNLKKEENKSQQIGNQILKTDSLIEEMQTLEDQLIFYQLKKRKLQNQKKYVQDHTQKIENHQCEIFQKSQSLFKYKAQSKEMNETKKNHQQLLQIYNKKQRMIAALKRGQKAKKTINSKKYCKLLQQLNQKQQSSVIIDQKYTLITEHIKQSKRIMAQLQELQKIVNLQRTAIKQSQKQQQIIEQSSSSSVFLTEKDNVIQSQQKKEFRNSVKRITNNANQILKEIQENLQKTEKTINNIQNQDSLAKNLSQLQYSNQNQGETFTNNASKSAQQKLTNKVSKVQIDLELEFQEDIQSANNIQEVQPQEQVELQEFIQSQA